MLIEVPIPLNEVGDLVASFLKQFPVYEYSLYINKVCGRYPDRDATRVVRLIYKCANNVHAEKFTAIRS